VILAVGLASPNPALISIPNIGVSLALFLLGATLTGQLAHYFGPRARWWLLSSNLWQTLLVFAAAGIQFASPTPQPAPSALGAIALLAFSSGAQVAAMRPMRVQEITTAMATAAWVDLVIDAQLLALHNHARDRRALFLAALVAGSFAGAYAHPVIGSANTLIVCAAGKLLVTLSMVCNRGEEREGVAEGGGC
jgi:uncharacterized membrane protein YoaK (UPF0700 family)